MMVLNNRFLKNVLLIIIILGMAYILTPRYWEPGGESWKQWAASRIFGETGGFPVFGLGPAYVIYLHLFQALPYPLSIQAEYTVTHAFLYMAILALLMTALPAIPAILLTSAWIPNLAVLEPGGAAAGMGFLALYCVGRPNAFFNRGYLPVSLLASTLCHSAYAPFLAGNIIGVFLTRNKNREDAKRLIAPLILRIVLIAIIVLTVLFPSRRWDHNHALMHAQYAPIPLTDPVTVAFFHIGNWKYNVRNTPHELLIYQDWYLTNDKAFNGAKTIPEAFIRAPDTVLRNLSENVISLGGLPMRLVTGDLHGVLPPVLKAVVALAAIFILPLGLIGFVRRYVETALAHVAVSVIFGAASIIGVLLLTWPSPRYVLTLLPVGLLMITHTGYGWQVIRGGKDQLRLTVVTALMSAALVTLTSVYPRGYSAQVEAVVQNKGFLTGGYPCSMTAAYKELLKDIDANTKVLALEDSWLKAYTKLNLDDIYSVLMMPPFPDKTGKVERTLNGFDMIWVNDAWTKEAPSVSTQMFLRYRLHVEPFLKKAVSRGWTVTKVNGYGKKYIRP